MAHKDVAAQEESRTELVGVRVTPSEKQDVGLVARIRRISESELMRPRILEIVESARKIRELSGENEAA